MRSISSFKNAYKSVRIDPTTYKYLISNREKTDDLLTKLRPHIPAKTKFTSAKTFTFQKKNKIL